MNKGLKIVLIVLTLGGLVGAAAALSKGFKEVPEFLIEHTEEHEISGGNTNPSNPDNPGTDDPEEIIKAAPTRTGKYKIVLTKKNLLNHPAVPPRVEGVYDLIVDSDVEYVLNKIDIKYSDTNYDSWSGHIVDGCEFYISTAYTGENLNYFEFGGFSFCDNYSLSVPGELNFTIEIFMDITNIDSPEAYTDLFKIGYQRIGDLDDPEEEPEDDPGETKTRPTQSGYYKIELTRDDLAELCNEDGVVLLIDELPLELIRNSAFFWLCQVTTIYNETIIDEWNESYHFRENCATSLEVHQDGTSLETQITSKNDGTSLGAADWYIDGFITPPEINYTLQIIINVISDDGGYGYKDSFINYYHKINNYIIPEQVSSSNFVNNREYVISPNLIASDIGRLTKNDTITFRKRSKFDFSILNEKHNLDSFEIVGNDNPKHIQCKDGGSSVVSGTSFTFEAYEDANFFITIEFNNNFSKNGYNQNIVYSNILGYVD